MSEGLPDSCRAAVYDPDRSGDELFEIRQMPMRSAKAGELIVRVTRSAVCGSDLHTITGRRRPRGPIILGHEICGRVAQVGEGATMSVGDRVTWGIAANCGECTMCKLDLPQKCEHLFKYGHESIDVDPALSGGFAEYVYLVPGTTVLKLQPDLADDTVVFANCSLATMAAAVRLADIQPGERVLVQGAGMVGLCATALCAARGASVVVTDVSDERLAWARRFGADEVSAPDDLPEVDAAIEACGQPEVVPQGVDALRLGGRYVLAGCVFPDATVSIDLHRITSRLIRLIGLHNYTPRDLHAAMEFLAGPGREFPFDQVVARRYPLDEINKAVDACGQGQDFLRVAIAPCDD